MSIRKSDVAAGSGRERLWPKVSAGRGWRVGERLWWRKGREVVFVRVKGLGYVVVEDEGVRRSVLMSELGRARQPRL